MIIDPSGRGPTMKQLYIAGAAGVIVFAVILAFLMARYEGYFIPKTQVVAKLGTTGDGLPSEADVKFRGMLVGTVDGVDVQQQGAVQNVRINLTPEFADGIPANVTARVVPSNLFAVTSVELVYNGADGNHLKEGSVIEEDRSKGTIALQDTLTSVRDILDEIDPVQFGRVLGTLTQALDGTGRVPGSTIQRLDQWVTEVSEAGPNLNGILNNFSTAAHALNESAPELLDVLGKSVQTSNTIAANRQGLIDVIAGTSATSARLDDLFMLNGDAGKQITTDGAIAFGALAYDPVGVSKSVNEMATAVAALNTTFTWGPKRQQVWNAGLTLGTPYIPYTAADCPRYGEMAGPNCATAPTEPILPELPENLRPRALDSAAGLAPLVSIPGLNIPGLTLPGFTPTAEPAQPGPIAGLPSIPGLPAIPGLTAPASATGPAAATKPAAAAPAATTPNAKPISYTGNAAIAAMLGRQPTVAEYLVFGPITKDSTLTVTEDKVDR
ncbi:MCE family protein [Nocardia sp. NPDC058658]|uniref:MlaD family protein n=1 Tax=Nocardia sp. NPDC058658 TaxID=3346580 RepID=UPI0036570A1F